MMIRLFVALLLFAAVPVMAAEDPAPAMPQLAQQQVRDTLLEQLQMQAREAQTRADEAERRERDAEIQRLADEARQAQAAPVRRNNSNLPRSTNYQFTKRKPNCKIMLTRG